MTIFEFVFSLYSLLFGLALAQVFAGLGNTLQERHKIKIGWLTPLLGLFVTFDITSFWAIGWEMRGMFRPDFLYLLCGVLLAGIYYSPVGWFSPGTSSSGPTSTSIISNTGDGCLAASCSAILRRSRFRLRRQPFLSLASRRGQSGHLFHSAGRAARCSEQASQHRAAAHPSGQVRDHPGASGAWRGHARRAVLKVRAIQLVPARPLTSQACTLCNGWKADITGSRVRQFERAAIRLLCKS